MPWKEMSPMDQRTQLIADYLRQSLTVTELCVLYGVSRKTAYKWIDRYLHLGPAGLEARHRHPSWGGKKLLTIVHKRHPRWDLPCRSTVCDILSRHGMVPKSPNCFVTYVPDRSHPLPCTSLQSTSIILPSGSAMV